MAKVAALYETRTLYRNFLNIEESLTFDQWNSLPHNKKAAALFVLFFNEIVLAWEKANTIDFIDCEDGVDVVNQYLEKNVPIIENDPKRFTAAYIYRVAYNCMYCICHDRKCDKDRLENETSSVVMSDGKEVNLLDFVSSKSDVQNDVADDMLSREFWSVIEDSGLEAQKVMRYLLSNNEDDLKKLSKRNKNYEIDPLRDVEVSLDNVQTIIEELREKFLSASTNSMIGQKLLEMTFSAT